MRTPRFSFAIALSVTLLSAACGGGSKSNPDAAGNPDAANNPDAPSGACAEFAAPEGTINGLGSFSGTVIGHGADLDVAMGVCTTEEGTLYFEPSGEDVVVAVTGLTVGTAYGVKLDTQADLSFYVATGCTNSAMGPAAGQCAVFDDQTFGTEEAEFTASATTEYIVVDTSDTALTAGDFTLSLVAPNCDPNATTSTCQAPTPKCIDFNCVECATSFDCTTNTKPECDPTGTCIASTAQCTGDDARDSGNGDDGPAAATTLTAPTAGTPTSITGAICNTPAGESDWYKVTLPAGDLGVALDFTGSTNDLDVGVFDSTGGFLGQGGQGPGVGEAFTVQGLTAGTYYLEVIQFAPVSNTAAVSYTLKINVPQCADDFGCVTANAPVCGGNGLCTTSPKQCVGDDAGDTSTGGDNGPAGARLLVPTVGNPASLPGDICTTPGTERDLYKVVIANGGSLDVQLAWTGTSDLDLEVLDSTGVIYGVDFWRQAATVSLTYLPAGTYYLQVTQFDAQGNMTTTVTPYTITASVTAPQVCASATDCAAEYQTQVFRGDCATGACHFINPTGNQANDTLCDANEDCASGTCSYVLFQRGAQKSVCSDTCTQNSDCTAIGAGLTCTTGLSTNFCMPSCGADLDCGADVNNSTLTTGTPWGYFMCTTATGVCTL